MTERQIKKLEIRVLIPPPPIQAKIIENDKNKYSKNPVLRFLKKFFGDGL